MWQATCWTGVVVFKLATPSADIAESRDDQRLPCRFSTYRPGPQGRAEEGEAIGESSWLPVNRLRLLQLPIVNSEFACPVTGLAGWLCLSGRANQPGPVADE